MDSVQEIIHLALGWKAGFLASTQFLRSSFLQTPVGWQGSKLNSCMGFRRIPPRGNLKHVKRKHSDELRNENMQYGKWMLLIFLKAAFIPSQDKKKWHRPRQPHCVEQTSSKQFSSTALFCGCLSIGIFHADFSSSTTCLLL